VLLLLLLLLPLPLLLLLGFALKRTALAAIRHPRRNDNRDALHSEWNETNGAS